MLAPLAAGDRRHAGCPTEGPPPGPHNFFRGGPLETYDAETRKAIATVQGMINAELATQVWETALGAIWHGGPVWVHGDVAAGNLLLRGGRLAAVIDFGCSGVGDPACDLVIAWTVSLRAESGSISGRAATRCPDLGTGSRWALWKALITFAGNLQADQTAAAAARRVIDEALDEHVHTV